MENKVKVWIARDKDGELYVHFDHQLIKGNRQWRRLHSEADSGVDIIKLYSNLFPSVKCEDEEPTEAYITLAEAQEQPTPKQEIDWEQRRYEIAKEMLPVIYRQGMEAQKHGQSVKRKDTAYYAVIFADMLIEKLREKSE